ncbi:MAG: 50S ribosomal protein L25 [Acidobacteriota bacterium]
MITDITVEAKLRTRTGSADSRRLRRQGLIPATVYGDRQDPLSVAIDAKQITGILRSESGHNTIFKLQPPNQEASIVMIKDWQLDPVRGKLMHADLLRISLTQKQRVSVPVELVGESIGVKHDAGILEHTLRELEIECLPADIPEHITVDVSNLGLGDHLLVKDLKVTGDIRVITGEDHVVAAVLAPRVAEETTAVAATETAEPEVIKKGKTEEKA